VLFIEMWWVDLWESTHVSSASNLSKVLTPRL
jgi:hypothetical protein